LSRGKSDISSAVNWTMRSPTIAHLNDGKLSQSCTLFLDKVLVISDTVRGKRVLERSGVDDCRFDVTLLVGGKKLRVRD